MIEFKNKRIFFSGIGDQVNIEELKNYILKNDALFVDTIAEANCIIEGDRTLPNIADDIYKAKLNGIEVIELNFLEKQFTQEFRFDSVLMAIKLSKDNERLLSLLKNKYFSDDMFVQLLKFYDWGGLDLYDNDENRDVCRQISLRFSTQNLSNHNIQYSPIGVYYAALETSNTQLLDLMYTMPSLSISFKNAKENQPLNLKEVVALNPNNSKTVQRQIIHNHQKRELYQLACNTNIDDAIKQELKALNDNEILKALLQSENYLLANQSELEMIMSNDVLKKYFLQYQKFDDTLFELLMEKISSDMEWIYLSKNSTLSTQMLQKIEEHNIPNATVNVLRHNRVDSNTVNKYLTLRDKIFNIA
ncbi:MAG: hypothetical protein U9N30_02585, partial [Campylobacterota bacterium]|nr:hypothetical protein [Campylobacterota bacterium]